MKNLIIRLSLFLALGAGLTLNSCKKQEDTDDSISAEDMSSVSASLNSTTDDAANVAAGIEALSGKTEIGISLCGATIDSSQKANGIIVLNYTGTGCWNGISRTGSITLTIENYASGIRWKDMGAVLQLQYADVKVTNTITGGYFTLNGTHTLTNITGGRAWRILDGLDAGTVQHRHTADNFTLNWADGSQRTWSVNRFRTFSNIAGVRSVTVSSDHTENGIANADAWGTNRRGDAFISAIVIPISSNSICGWHKPVQGEFTHHVGSRSLDIHFGVDISGNTISTGCAYGFKITYTRNGRERTRVVSYWF